MSGESPPDPDQRAGYLVLLRPEQALQRWREEVTARASDPVRFQEHLVALRRVHSRLAHPRYRGIQRYPLARAEAVPAQTGADLRARQRMLEALGPDPTVAWTQPPWFDPDLLESLGRAREVLALVDVPDEHEVAQVIRGSAPANPTTLGFDVGYWGSDHFSVIADVMVMPEWHPAPPSSLAGLARWAARLNESLLFTTSDDAGEYRDWYRTQTWAEHENGPDQFQIIRVDEPTELANA